MLKEFLMFCFVLSNNTKSQELKHQELKTRKTEYLIYHQEISNFNVYKSDNPEILLDFEFRKVNYGSIGNFSLEEGDIIKPFVYKILYSLNPGDKLSFD
jgi:hypothetical protein